MSIIKLIASKHKLDKAKESFKESVAAVKKEAGLDKTANKIIQKAKTENVLIVKMQSYSVGTMAKTLLGVSGAMAVGSKSQYQITTKDGTEEFASDMETTLLTDRDILTVYDTRNGKTRIGTVKQWLISGGIPLFEKEAKTCTVTMGNEKLCDLKKCVSFGDLQIEAFDGRIEIKIKSNGNFSIYHKGKKIAELHELPMKLKDGFVDRYVLEYKEEKDKQVAVMMAIALDTVNE
ncbi:MAG: hypothetical protein E7561_01080 [Ruminococcaceae bacterium]|nr:hypothetical protein [Oscillospiraceae bacterium]